VSVDTYLKGKRINGYVSISEGDLRLLVSQTLYREAESVRLDVSEFLLWRKINAVAVPRADHFHSPACRH
jgi:hypothetical protein